MNRTWRSALPLMLLVAGLAAAQTVQDRDMAPTGKGIGDSSKRVQRFSRGNGQHHKPPPSNGIFYHGGPLILGGTHYYYIWYGNWSADTATTILPNFATDESGSGYFNINTTYYDGSNTHVTNSISMSGQYFEPSEYLGNSLSDSDILQIVTDTINNGHLPSDTNGVYFVLTQQDVDENSGFCTAYCGWHTSSTINGADIKFSFVGNPARCMSSCAPGQNQTVSPNNNPGADGMANIIAHEGEEATTDPDLNAWFDLSGEENADKCAWQFGSTQTAGNGSTYNQTMGSHQYLIQMNWVNANGGLCAQKYP